MEQIREVLARQARGLAFNSQHHQILYMDT